VIPNAIDLDEYPGEGLGREERQRLILFLGRVEPKKGVDILLRAFAMANLSRDWRVAIIGPVWSPAYQEELERIVAENGLGDRVSFLGPVFGEEKRSWLRRAWIMVAPSHSEVVGLVNLEAAALQTPSITTHETGLFDWESGGGLLIHPEVDQLCFALERVCAWSESERAERGMASRRLVSERYSWNAVLPKWISLYESLVVRG
jgi:glycosyltransferase involved in cell wall biosynthesis